ncbi:unnamed protein product [Caenorhabditis bovis]|uniref:Uncharacterized protein n=1 Tax=Caenorhabditis bovis TaxID=2654633 RepID=A0A8S1EQV1_9PELO|nr:unnamed protein product [Caenorhabditis bovis]
MKCKRYIGKNTCRHCSDLSGRLSEPLSVEEVELLGSIAKDGWDYHLGIQTWDDGFAQDYYVGKNPVFDFFWSLWDKTYSPGPPGQRIVLTKNKLLKTLHYCGRTGGEITKDIVWCLDFIFKGTTRSDAIMYWYVTLMELICPKELLARSLRNVYLTDIMSKTKEAIRELLLPTSNRWKSRFDFNDIYEKMKEGEPKIIVCDEKFVGVSKTMWHLYTNSTGNVTIETSILFRGRPFRFRVTTDVYEEKHFRVNWDFDIAFDLLMASFFLN